MLDLSTLPAASQVAAIYIGYYDRAGEPQGSTFWESAVANPDFSLEAIATDFSTQQETLDVHPFFSNPTAEAANAFITEVYLNLFNREPDADGLTFWSGVLQAAIDGTGTMSVGAIILEIIQGAQDSAAGNDRATILNKIEVATAWTDAAEVQNFSDTAFADLPSSIQASAKSIIEPVTDSSATVVAARETIDEVFPGPVVPGDTILLTSATDVLTGTANDDEFNGYIQQNPFAGGISNSLSSADRLDGGAGNDRLYAELTEEFIGVNGANEIDVQPRIKNIEEIDLEARDSDGNSNTGAITVDAKNITDHQEIGSFYSDGDLTIENLTTLLDSGTARNTADITVTMDHTDNFNSDGDASDLIVYFDNDYLLAGEVSVGTADFFLLDQDAELRLLTGGTAEGRLDEIDRNGIIFSIGDGDPVTIAFDEALLDEANPAEINTHDAFIAALQQPLQDAIQAGLVPAGTQIVRVDYPAVIFDDDGLALNRAGLQDGSFSDLIPSVQVVSGDGSAVTPLGYSFPTGIVGEFNVFGRFDQFADETPEPISIDIDLEKAGRGGEGGDLIVGGKAQNVNEGIADGIEVFNISVKGIGGDGALAKPSNLGTITSTGNELEVINIVTDPAFVGGDSFASLVVRNGFDQDGVNDLESGDLRLVDANGFFGNLTLGDIDALQNAGRITNLDTLTALGGGDVEFNALLDGNEGSGAAQAYTYLTGAGNDIIDIDVDGDATDFAGASLNIQTGGGNDTVRLDFDLEDIAGQNEQLNQSILDNVLIETGGGNDTITIDDDIAVPNDLGNANILAGADNDVVYTDGTADDLVGVAVDQNAVWALNFDDVRAVAQGGIGQSAPDDLPGVQESLAYVGGATVTVTLSGAGVANLFDGGGVMAFGHAIDGDNGYEASTTVTVAGPNDFYGTQTDVNDAVLRAINEDPVLNKLLVASIGANNTVVVQSLTSGNFAFDDLRVDIDQRDADSLAYANNVLSEAQREFFNSDLSLSDLWGTSTFASAASYQGGAPGANLTTSATANAWYDGLSVSAAPGEIVNLSMVDNLHTAGFASTFEQDNLIDGGAGDDVIVLSTDAIANGVTPFSVSPNNALLNGASNQTVVFTGASTGDDTVMNFTTAGITSVLNGGLDFLDFTAYLTSMENTTTNTGSDSDVFIPVTLDDDMADVQANEVSVVTFDNTDDSPETFAALSASVIEQLFNNGSSFTGFNGDQNYGNLSASTSTLDDEYTQNLPSTDQLIAGAAKSILMVENADNDGEYKLFEITWNGDFDADADSSNDGIATSVVELGSVDFGESLVGLTAANLVGSAEFAQILATGLNGGGVVVPPPTPGLTTVVLPTDQGALQAVAGDDTVDQLFTLDVDGALATDPDTQISLSSFDIANDVLQFDLATATGASTLDQLNGQQGVNILAAGPNTIVNFGNDNDGDPVILNLIGVSSGDLSSVVIDIV